MRPSLPAIAAIALLLAAVRAAAPVGPAPAARAGALAQAPAEPALAVTLYADTVVLRTLPYAPITALLDNGARGRSEGFGFSGADGTAAVAFFDGGQVVRPGSRLTLARPGDAALDVTVPDLGADVDVAADRIVGRAPAGAEVEVEVLLGAGPAPERVARTLTAAADGSFELALGGTHDLQPGAARGSARLTTPDGVRVAADFAAAAAELTLGATSLRGASTPGSTVAVSVRAPDGATATLGPIENVGGAAFALGTPESLVPPLPPLAAGSGVTLTVTSPVLATPATVVGTLGSVTIALDPSRETVAGVAPAGAAVALEADSLEGLGHRGAATAGNDGAYAADWSGAVDLRAGWRVRAAYDAAPGLSVGALAVIPAIHVGVGLPESRGLAEPGQAVTVTLESPGGARLSIRETADDQGAYAIAFGSPFSPSPSGPRPGDRVEVSVVRDDPLVLEVPSLSAVADVAADAVRGEAPPGSSVRVRVESAAGAPTAEAVADAGGSYAAGFAGTLDLVRPAHGTVTLTRGDGNAFFATWAAIRVSAVVGGSLQPSFVAGNGPVGRWVSVELVAPSGAVVATGGSPVFEGDVTGLPGAAGSGTAFFAELLDVAGTPVAMEAGDTLRVTAGDEVVELPIPRSEAVILVPADTVAGRTAPGAAVDVWISGTSSTIDVHATATADAAGNYAASLAGAYDIRHGDQVLVGAGVQGHQILDAFLAPGLLLEVDQGVLLGSLAPDVAVEIAVRRGADVVARARARTDADGAMTAVLADAAGASPILRPGDVVTAAAVDPAFEPLTLAVPELTIAWDVARDAVGGTATPGGDLTLLATVAYPRPGTFGIAQSWPELDPAGAYETDFVPAPDIAPGSRITALYRPIEGHYVVRSRTVPILSAEHGGPTACGYGEPRASADLTLWSGGAERARTKPATRFDGHFGAIWRDAEGGPLASATGERVTADLGEVAAELDLPAFDLVVDPRSALLQGVGPADAWYTVQPASPCPLQPPPSLLAFGPTFAQTGRTEADGSFQTFSPVGSAPGAGVEIAFLAPDGHRWFRHAYWTRATIHLDEDRVTGVATALSDVALVLRDGAGAERGRATAEASPLAAFEGRMSDAAGAPAVIRAGDVLSVEAQGATVDIEVEPLSFDWSPGASAIAGAAPAGRAVQLLLRLEGGGVVAIPLRAGADGRIGFGAGDVPPRAAWSLADVEGVRLVLGTPGGHEILVQTASFEGGPAPRGPGSVYIPVAHSGRRAAAALAGAGAPPGAAVAPPPSWPSLLSRRGFGVPGSAPAMPGGSLLAPAMDGAADGRPR